LVEAANPQSGRLARWILKLQEFDFDIRHKPGKANANADALSRLPTTDTQSAPLLAVNKEPIVLPTREDVRRHQEADPLLHAVIDFLKHPEHQEAPADVKEVLRDTGLLSVDSGTGLLMHTATVNGRRHYVPVLPPAIRLPVIRTLHDLPLSAHLGYKKTYHKIRSQFYWKGMAADIKAFVRSCVPCQTRKPPPPSLSGHLHLFSASRPFEVVGIDILGPLPRTQSGNRYVVVMVDRFSRWTELAAVPDITASTVADVFVDRIILRHGCPAQLLSDRGSQFLSALFKRLTQRLGIHKIFTSAYHPQTNGQVERLNRFIASALTAYVNAHQDDWDTYLEALAFAYRTSFVDAIGNTPFYLVHGRDPCLPTDILSGNQPDLDVDVEHYGLALTQAIKDAYTSARVHQDTADTVRKRHYDARHHPVHFPDGSLVFLYCPGTKPGVSSKLRSRYDGPYRVLRQLSDVLYEIRHLSTGKVVNSHVQRLQRAYLPAPDDVSQPISVAVPLNPDLSDDSAVDPDDYIPSALDTTAAPPLVRRSDRSTAGVPAARYDDSF
jgi:transposase InsO family protein